MTETAPKDPVDSEFDIGKFWKEAPPAVDFVLPGLAEGTVGVFVAPGASGKSWWALEASVAIAAADVPSSDLMGLGNLKSGRVVILSAEDPEIPIWGRMHAIAKRINDPAVGALVRAHLSIINLMGVNANLASQEWSDRVIAKITRIGPTRLIVIDTARRFHDGDEQDNNIMTSLMKVLEHIAKETGAAILVIHHTNKASVLNGQGDTIQASRGASGLVDNARFVSFLQRMTREEATSFGIEETEERKKFVRYGVSKASYSRILEDVWLEQGDDGVLVPANLGGKKKPAKKAAPKAPKEAMRSSHEA